MQEKSILDGAIEMENETIPEVNYDTESVHELPTDNSGISINLEWLKTPTGDGSIEDYIEHPLNFLKSKGFAQVLRGATGFFGNLKLALIDIVLGMLQFFKERKAGNNAGDIGKQA